MTPQEKIAMLRAKAAANRAKMEQPKETKETSDEETKADDRHSDTDTGTDSNTGAVCVVGDQAGSNSVVPANTSLCVDSGTQPLTAYEPFKMKLAELSQALEEEIPGFALLLRDIHREMQRDPNVVTIMTPDEIGSIVKGLTKHMDITIVPAKTASGRAKAGSRTQPLTADDL